MSTVKATCTYFILGTEFLAAKKTRKIGIGKYFGYGGGFEPEDKGDPPACTYREVLKETNGSIIVQTEMLEPLAIITFYKGEKLTPYQDDPTAEVLFYRSFQEIKNIPESSDEMDSPTLLSIFRPPWDQMMPGDRLILPHVFAGAPIKGMVHFTEDEKRVVQSIIRPCSLDELILGV